MCHYRNGDYYEGGWRAGLRHGWGMQQCTDGSNYVSPQTSFKLCSSLGHCCNYNFHLWQHLLMYQYLAVLFRV